VLPAQGQYVAGRAARTRASPPSNRSGCKEGRHPQFPGRRPGPVNPFYKHLVKQETREKSCRQITSSTSTANSPTVRKSSSRAYWKCPAGTQLQPHWTNWISVDDIVRQVSGQSATRTVEIRKLLAIDGSSCRPSFQIRQLLHDGRQQGRFHGFALLGVSQPELHQGEGLHSVFLMDNARPAVGSCRWESAGHRIGKLI